MDTRVPSRTAGGESVADVLDRWEHEGLVSTEQAETLRQDLAAHAEADTPGRGLPRVAAESLLTEALSYLGGVLVLVAGGLLTARSWDDLAFGGRSLLAAAAAALLLGAGLLVPRRLGAAGQRVRRVLWLLGTAAFAGLLGIVAVDGLDQHGADVGMVVAGGSGVLAAALWWRERGMLQHLAMFGGCAGFVAFAGVQLLGDHQGVVPGMALLGVAAPWGVAARRGRIAPERTGIATSGSAALFGALTTTGSEEGWAFFLAVLTVIAVVTVAVVLNDLALLGTGAVGALLVLPGTVGHFFPSVVAAAVVLLVAGIGLIASGLTIASGRSRHG